MMGSVTPRHGARTKSQSSQKRELKKLSQVELENITEDFNRIGKWFVAVRGFVHFIGNIPIAGYR